MAVKKEYKQIALYMLLLGFGVLLVGAIGLSGSGNTLLVFFKSLGVQFGFIVLCVLAYGGTLFTGELLGLGKNKGFHILSGIGIGIFYLMIASFIPGFSIAIPSVPNAVSDGLRGFIVTIVAPIVESVALLGVLLGILKKKFKKPLTAIVLTGLISSFYHLGSYIVGLYNYSFSEGLLGFSANISVFISAFIFFTLSGYLVHLKAYKGLLVAIILHIVINLFVFIDFAVAFTLAMLSLL